MNGKTIKNFSWDHFSMKKWDQLQVILDNSKSEEEQGDY